MQDDTGHEVAIGEVRRVVSIVPSLTEALAETHQDLLVGVTDWCTHPADLSCARVRGTKNPDVDAIVALQPDLVLANSEENREPDLQALREAGVAVWVTYPRTVPQAIESLGRMLTACGVERPAWLDAAAASWAAPHEGPRRTAVIPIWRRTMPLLGSSVVGGGYAPSRWRSSTPDGVPPPLVTTAVVAPVTWRSPASWRSCWIAS